MIDEPVVQIRRYETNDFAEWLRMRRALWPEIIGEDEEKDATQWLARTDATVIVAVRPENAGLAGFLELGSRPYADGCRTTPVAFLEGWFVDEDMRRQGLGGALVRAGEQWAREYGFLELASDALISNTASHRAHVALGFAEVERAIRFRKDL